MTVASKKKLSKERLTVNEEWAQTAELMESPFKAKGAKKEGELDQHYTVLPAEEWGGMKSYNNFISECAILWWKD